jgi:hypothetical protein
MTSRRDLRAPLLAIAVLALAAVVAIPALAASPSPAPGTGHGNGTGPRASREPAVAVTLHGVVTAATDADGRTSYTMTAGGKTVRLAAGPPWFFATGAYPLASFVGKTVTITGSQRGDEVDVEAVDGTPIRAAGKPPWAGGWKAVGSAHPGWSQDKWDRWQERHPGAAGGLGGPGGNGAAPGAAGCWPPGHCKPHGSDDPAETPDPNGG